jgi:predicted nucleotidyltransferase
MTRDPLVASELELVLSVLRQHPEVVSATLFGSRAKGTHSDRSDVDLALAGPLGSLGAEAIAAELDDLPLPYRFDVQALAAITHAPLLEQIERVGMVIYRGNERAFTPPRRAVTTTSIRSPRSGAPDPVAPPPDRWRNATHLAASARDGSAED